MKKLFTLILFFIVLGCGAQSQNQFNAKEFSEKLKNTPDAQLIDVRTPGEFSKGFIENAKNFDWNGSDFQTQISTLDKNKPVFVYCLSGGRSASAANAMRNAGFSKVYELSGGMMQWRSQNLPEAKPGNENKASIKGLTTEQYKSMLDSKTPVLIDFYADWCAPCKKMKPYLDKMDHEMKTEVKIIRIDADENPELCKTLKIEALPVVKLYHNKKIVWENVGFVEEKEVKKQIQSIQKK